MTGYTTVPTALWRDIHDFFSAIVAPCKNCVRGNPVRCWQSECPAFQFRDIARRVEESSVSVTVRVPKHILVENEILEALRRYGTAAYPSQIILSSTRSKANKRNAIDRLVRKGLVVEERINQYTSKISLPNHQRNPKDEQPKPTNDNKLGSSIADKLNSGHAGPRQVAGRLPTVRHDQPK